MTGQRLDIYESFPPGMLRYLQTYGWHFNRKMCQWAVSMMRRRNQSTGKDEPLDFCDKDKVSDTLKRNSVQLDNDIAYDAAYVYNMARADYLKSSIADEAKLSLFVKDYLDDPDGYQGKALTQFYADCIGKGVPVMWEDMLVEDSK